MTLMRRARAGFSALHNARAAPSVLPSVSPWFPVHSPRNPALSDMQRRLGRLVLDNPAALVATEAFSLGATAYASVFPSVSFATNGELVICTGLPEGAYPRGGICVGRVFLTGKPPSPRVVAHEKRHVAQWLRYGILLPVLYAASGREPLTNWFEVEAGLADGNYV